MERGRRNSGGNKIKKQISADLSERTKRKLEKLAPEKISEVINKAFEEVNKGSVLQMDALIRKLM